MNDKQTIMEIIDEYKLLEIKKESLKFVQENISLNGEENWDLIFDLKRQLLTLEHSMIIERQRLIEQAKKREDRVSELLEQVEQLKRQIR